MRRIGILAIVILFCTAGPATAGKLSTPDEYLSAKIQENDIVFLGIPNKNSQALGFVTKMIPTLTSLGVTHIGLEIASDQQAQINKYMKTGKELKRIKISKKIKSPAYLRLLETLQQSGGPVPVAIDRPYSQRRGALTSNQWMARTLVRLLPAKVVVVVENSHTLKKLDWQEKVKRKDQSVRQYLAQGNPEMRMVSVGQVAGVDADKCDFASVFSPLPDAVALDLDRKNQGWKLGFVTDMDLVPTESYDLMDGLIVY